MKKEQAAAALRITVRTLQRHMAAHRIGFAMRKTATGEEATFSPEEVARFKAQRDALTETVTPAVNVSEVVRSSPQALQRAESEQGVSISPVTLDTGDTRDTPEMRLRMLAAFEAMASPARLSEKLTLTLTEASLLSGLSRGHLREAIEQKKLKARIIGRGWRVKRSDLDNYVAKL